MISPEDLKKIWSDQKKSIGNALCMKELTIPKHFGINCIYRCSDKTVGIAMRLHHALTIGLKRYQQFNSFEIKLIKDPLDMKGEKVMLLVLLKEHKYEDTFSALCASLIKKLTNAASDKEAVFLFANHIEEWTRLFGKSYANGLSKNAQMGLWAELHILKSIIENKPNLSFDDILDFWVGSQKSIQDFQGKGWALEVKATRKNNGDVVTIHGFRQLDESPYKYLYLCHISLNETKNNGISLPQKIAEVKSCFANNLIAESLFTMKLAEYGYFAEMKNLYKNITYQIREKQFYIVKDEFPRIKENETRDGLINAEYDISLSAAQTYKVSQDEVIMNIG